MIHIKYKLGASKIHGTGLFADQDITSGQLIYTPNTLLDVDITQKEFDSLSYSEKTEVKYYGYIHKKTGNWHVAFDAIRMLNHHNELANVIQDNTMVMVAKRNILSGEELLQNYLDFDNPEELSNRFNLPSTSQQLVHHHFIYQAKVDRNDLGPDAEVLLRKFLYDLVIEIDMEVLIDPVLKFSKNDAWTGLIGIVTSHISFHYWTKEKYLQLDIYSCKSFNVQKTKVFLDTFWKSYEQKIIFINRESGNDFLVEKIL